MDEEKCPLFILPDKSGRSVQLRGQHRTSDVRTHRPRSRRADRPYHPVRPIGRTATIYTNQSDAGTRPRRSDGGALGGSSDALIGRAAARDAGQLDRTADGETGWHTARSDGAVSGKHPSSTLEELCYSTSTPILLANQTEYIFLPCARVSRTVLVIVKECSYI